MKRRAPKEHRDAERERTYWATQFPVCWACGSHWYVETHEIVRRSETSDWRHLCNYTRLCRACHEEAHGGYLTKGVLLTLKLLHDGARYDPEWIRAHAIAHHWEAQPLPEQVRLTVSHAHI